MASANVRVGHLRISPVPSCGGRDCLALCGGEGGGGVVRLSTSSLGNRASTWTTKHPTFHKNDKQTGLSLRRVTGSRAFVHVEVHHIKLQTRVCETHLVGYSVNSEGCRIYNPRTRKVVENQNVALTEAVVGIVPPVNTSDDTTSDYSPGTTPTDIHAWFGGGQLQ